MLQTHRGANDHAAEPENNPDLPRMIQVGDVLAPAAPVQVSDTGLDSAVLLDLALKAAYTVPQFTTDWMARRLHLPQTLVGELLEQHRTDRLLEVLGQTGPFGYRYAISQRGRERAQRLMEISGYIGPAPVSLAAYSAFLDWQIAHTAPIIPEQVSAALSELVLTDEASLTAGLAVSSGRSLFVFGPSGNGKTSLGRALHRAIYGEVWVPYCIGLESSFIRVFDPQVHERVDVGAEQSWKIDQRWVKIRRPLIVGGGEMTLDSFELLYSPSLRYYEAPLHVKANGGTFLIDDFGRQRLDPHALLNRWIIPLEHQIDYLTLHTGQKIQIPFRQMLVIATNLSPQDVTDPAFLRRMGYRLLLDRPDPQRYTEIFQRYATRAGTSAAPALTTWLLERYQAEGRELRCCEARDLIERARDICRFLGRPFELNEEVLTLAWVGYFGRGGAVSEVS